MKISSKVVVWFVITYKLMYRNTAIDTELFFYFLVREVGPIFYNKLYFSGTCSLKQIIHLPITVVLFLSVQHIRIKFDVLSMVTCGHRCRPRLRLFQLWEEERNSLLLFLQNFILLSYLAFSGGFQSFPYFI